MTYEAFTIVYHLFKEKTKIQLMHKKIKYDVCVNQVTFVIDTDAKFCVWRRKECGIECTI